MSNPGNTGQRYKMSKFASVDAINDKNLRVTLECGHSYQVREYGTIEEGIKWYQERIAKGKRTRCNDCKVSA